MKISAKDEYACSAVLELALNYDNDPPVVRVQDIAERHDIPMKFLFQIMQILKRVDIVRSKRGTEGGYILARQPSQITVGDVIRSVSGPDPQPSPSTSNSMLQTIAFWNASGSSHHLSPWSDGDSAQKPHHAAT